MHACVLPPCLVQHDERHFSVPPSCLCPVVDDVARLQVHRVQQGPAASAERLSGANTRARIVATVVPTGFRKQSAAEFLIVVTPESEVLTVVKPCTRVVGMMQQ